MRIYPAIDIKDGKCVRLVQGDFDKVTVFNDNPYEVGIKWANAGASFLHIVDLDGARKGVSYNDTAIKDILSNVNIPIQVGGGIRTMQDIENKINMGVSRIILGSASVNNSDFVKEAVNNFGDKIAVGIDAKNGKVAINGWEEVSSVTAIDLCKEMASLGVKTIIYTDISKDGMMMGPNIPATEELVNLVNINIIASGGVSNISDLEKLSLINVEGVIIGKALFQGAIDLKMAIDTFEK